MKRIIIEYEYWNYGTNSTCKELININPKTVYQLVHFEKIMNNESKIDILNYLKQNIKTDDVVFEEYIFFIITNKKIIVTTNISLSSVYK